MQGHCAYDSPSPKRTVSRGTSTSYVIIYDICEFLPKQSPAPRALTCHGDVYGVHTLNGSHRRTSQGRCSRRNLGVGLTDGISEGPNPYPAGYLQPALTFHVSADPSETLGFDCRGALKACCYSLCVGQAGEEEGVGWGRSAERKKKKKTSVFPLVGGRNSKQPDAESFQRAWKCLLTA